MNMFSKYTKLALEKIETSDEIRNILKRLYSEKEYTALSKRFHNVCLKHFYKWLYSLKEPNYKLRGEFPPLVKGLRSSIKKSEYPVPQKSEVLNMEEVYTLIKHACFPL